MFGFVTVSEQDLSEDEKARYRQVYCGICRSLHLQSGQLSRLTLNHDLAFMALMHLSLYEPVERTGSMHCLLHPIESRAFTSNKYVDYAADMTVVMAYHKLMDNWADDRHHASFAFAQLFKKRYREIAEKYPRQCAATEEGLARIAGIEASWDGNTADSNPDAAADAFGRILAEVFVIDEDNWARQLRAFGYELGRFVYMMDAAMDAEKDRKSKSYNPFFGYEFSSEELRTLLSSYMARATWVFERLPLVQDEHMLRSVLYAGVWGRFNEQMRAAEKKSPDNDINDAAAVEMAKACPVSDAYSEIINTPDADENELDKEPVSG